MDTLSRKQKFTLLFDHIIDDENVDKNTLLVYLALAKYANKDRTCFPGIRTISKVARINSGSTQEGIKKLITLGYLRKESHSGKANHYELFDTVSKSDTVSHTDTDRISYGYTSVSHTDTEQQKSNNKIINKVAAYCDLVTLLMQRIENNDPNYFKSKNKKSVADKWYDPIRLLIERDGRDIATVRNVIEWCQSDDFWKSNILSAKKLREKFPQLLLQMRNPRKSNPGGNNGTGIPEEEYIFS